MKINLQDYLNFINIKFSVSISQLKKFFQIKNTKYQTIKSNKQIQTIVKSKNKKYLHSLLSLFSKDFSHITDLDNKILTTIDDSKFYNFLNNNQKGGGLSIKIFAHKIKKYIIYRGRKINSYLDVGCANGKKTIELAKYLKIKNVYGADVDQWFGLENQRNKYLKNFELIKNDKLNFNNNSFDLITSFMVLHHVQNLEKIIKEIYRVLKPKGYFFISEHDVFTDEDAMLVDVQHAIYELAIRKNKKFYTDYYGKYYNKYEWHYIMHKNNFRLIHYNYYNYDARFEVTPTRYFYAIYQKI